jgi:hypothetical protein
MADPKLVDEGSLLNHAEKRRADRKDESLVENVSPVWSHICKEDLWKCTHHLQGLVIVYVSMGPGTHSVVLFCHITS